MLARAATPLLVLTALLPAGRLPAQGVSLKADALAEAPPAEAPAAIREALQENGVRLTDEKGEPFADVWLRKGVPASGKPAGAKGTILFPVLAEGELVGLVKFAAEGHDYRDQAIAPGAYTLRYGLQPVNGDHLGVSPYRDYLLLLPAAKDTSLDRLAEKPLQGRSAEAAGSNHPAVLMLLTAPGGARAPSVARDDEKGLSGLVLELPLAVEGQSQAVPLPVQLIVLGAAPV